MTEPIYRLKQKHQRKQHECTCKLDLPCICWHRITSAMIELSYFHLAQFYWNKPSLGPTSFPDICDKEHPHIICSPNVSIHIFSILYSALNIGHSLHNQPINSAQLPEFKLDLNWIQTGFKNPVHMRPTHDVAENIRNP